ncbi:methyl-accepting chemotaxis protein [uncultured Methanoregula sp.]|uniref:methyl-accepting chemotaxis protein n=1 Tax=uncultured Methanoregula sp. TaxID=1005933 RepID=UPI002AAAABFC|nr:methyl-accepting chemotaxis protein [uncultured Methanoregula sp.]
MIELKEMTDMFEKNPLSQAVVDADLNILLVNDAFTKLVGYNKDRLIGIRFTDFKDKNMIKYLESSGEGVGDAVNMRRTTVGRSTFDTPTGIHIVIRTNIPIFGEKGEIKYVYVTYNEITKVVKAQNYMAKEVEELSKIYAIMAKGDLTPRYNLTEPDADTKDGFDLLVKLRDSVRGIIASLQKNIGDVNKQMLNLTSTADNATRSVEDASKSVNQIAKNAGEVSENAQKASEGVEQMSKAMQDMSAAVEEITSSMESVSSQANNANASAKSGAILAENVNKDMMDITLESGKTYDVIKEIEKQMTDIGKIIVLIRDLASQTNLLALNAAIEAARAGEHGRGFAVVASEVKSLAQESRSSAEKIEEMITQLNLATKKAADGMAEAKKLVGKGAAESQQALDAFRTIQKAAETVANSASEVAAATEEQAATTEEITASVHEVANLIERTAKEAGDAAAATEESAAAIDEITLMIQTVNDVAIGAMEANKKFKVD